MDRENKGPKRRSPRKKPPSVHYRGDNSGGYGNPPIRSQFPLKNPGGPGRPQGVTNIEAAFQKKMRQKMQVKRDGKILKMTPHEVFAERALESILSKKSSPAMLDYGFKLFAKYGPKTPSIHLVGLDSLSEVELYLLELLFAKSIHNDELDEPVKGVDQELIDQAIGTYTVTFSDANFVVIEKSK